MKYYVSLIILSLLFVCSRAQALDNDNEPWEWEDLSPSPKADTSAFVPNGVVVSEKLIGLYRNRIAVNSISRCPFKISCSHFAQLAIERYGFFKGVCLFIDRNFYRENIGIMYYYPFVEDVNGLLKLDDAYYLFPTVNGGRP